MEHKLERYFADGADISDDTIDELTRKAHSRLAPALARIRRPLARIAAIDSSIGRLLAAHSSRGLLALRFMDSDDSAAVLEAIRQRFDLIEDAALEAEIGSEI